MIHYYLHTAQRADWPGWRRIGTGYGRLGQHPGVGSVTAATTRPCTWFDPECRQYGRGLPARWNIFRAGHVRGDEIDPLRWQLAFQLKSYLFLSKRTYGWPLIHQLAFRTIRAGDRIGEAITRNNSALAWHERGDDGEAIPRYEAAERLFADLVTPMG